MVRILVWARSSLASSRSPCTAQFWVRRRAERVVVELRRPHRRRGRKAREDWRADDRFGEVKGYDGARLLAPEVPAAQLKARVRVR
jgi:hypothetical protein